MSDSVSVPAAVASDPPPAAPVVPRPAPLWLVLTAFAAVYVVWGSTYLGITIAVKSIPPFLMAGTRFIIAGSLLYGVMRWRGEARPTRQQWLGATAVGALLLLVGNGGVTWAQGRVASGVSALIIASVPLWIMLVDWVRPMGKRPTVVVLLGLAVGAAGVALIIASRNATGQRTTDPLGAFVLVASALGWALGSVYARHAAKPASAWLAVSMQMLAGGALQLLTGLLLLNEGPQLHLASVTVESALAFVYLTMVGSLIGYTAYFWLLQVSTPARVSTYAYVNPLVAVLLGHLVLKETLPPAVMLAAGLILISVILVLTPARRRGKLPAEVA